MEDFTVAKSFSKTIIHLPLPKSNSFLHYFTPMSTHQEQFACPYQTKKRTGGQPLQSNRSFQVCNPIYYGKKKLFYTDLILLICHLNGLKLEVLLFQSFYELRLKNWSTTKLKKSCHFKLREDIQRIKIMYQVVMQYRF